MSTTDPLGEQPRTHEEHERAVAAFGGALVAKLNANAHKAHWSTVKVPYLLKRLMEEVGELADALIVGDTGNARLEAVDVGALAMMLFERCGPKRKSYEAPAVEKTEALPELPGFTWAHPERAGHPGGAQIFKLREDGDDRWSWTGVRGDSRERPYSTVDTRKETAAEAAATALGYTVGIIERAHGWELRHEDGSRTSKNGFASAELAALDALRDAEQRRVEVERAKPGRCANCGRTSGELVAHPERRLCVSCRAGTDDPEAIGEYVAAQATPAKRDVTVRRHGRPVAEPAQQPSDIPTERPGWVLVPAREWPYDHRNENRASCHLSILLRHTSGFTVVYSRGHAEDRYGWSHSSIPNAPWGFYTGNQGSRDAAMDAAEALAAKSAEQPSSPALRAGWRKELDPQMGAELPEHYVHESGATAWQGSGTNLWFAAPHGTRIAAALDLPSREAAFDAAEEFARREPAPAREPYTVEVGEPACGECGDGALHDVVGPDGAALGTRYGDGDEAQYIAGLLNCAYAHGVEAARDRAVRLIEERQAAEHKAALEAIQRVVADRDAEIARLRAELSARESPQLPIDDPGLPDGWNHVSCGPYGDGEPHCEMYEHASGARVWRYEGWLANDWAAKVGNGAVRRWFCEGRRAAMERAVPGSTLAGKTEPVAAGVLAQLRNDGWAVAVHNDYRLHGERKTFWLFTHPNGRWIKGEGATDAEAIAAASRSAMLGKEAAHDQTEQQQALVRELERAREEFADLEKERSELLAIVTVTADRDAWERKAREVKSAAPNDANELAKLERDAAIDRHVLTVLRRLASVGRVNPLLYGGCFWIPLEAWTRAVVDAGGVFDRPGETGGDRP